MGSAYTSLPTVAPVWTDAELLERLGWPSPIARAWALERATERRLSLPVARMQELLGDDDRDVALAAIKYISRMALRDWGPTLADLWSASGDATVRANAIGALGDLDREAPFHAAAGRAGGELQPQESSFLQSLLLNAVADGDPRVPYDLLHVAAGRGYLPASRSLVALVGPAAADPYQPFLLNAEEVARPDGVRGLDAASFAGRLEVWRKESAASISTPAGRFLADGAVEAALRMERVERALKDRNEFHAWWPDAFNAAAEVALGRQDFAKEAERARSTNERILILLCPWAVLPDAAADALIEDGEIPELIRRTRDEDLEDMPERMNAARMLARRGGPEGQIAATRLGMLDWEDYPIPTAAALEGLAAAFEPMENDEQVSALHVLLAFAHPAALRLAEAHYESLIRSEAHAEFVGFLGTMARPELFERLAAEWAPGEPALAAELVTIAEVNGRPVPHEWRLEGTEFDEMFRAFATAAFREREEVVASLRCVECGRSYRYAFDFVLVGDGEDAEDSIRFPRIVVCKKCGALDRWEISPESRTAVMLQAMVDPERRLRGGRLTVGALGRPVEFRTIGDAIRACEAQLEGGGGDSDLLVAIGNLYRHGGLADRSIPYYERALAAAPGRGNARRGLELALEGRTDFDVADVDRSPREEAPPARGKKIGRNDPCPCGSGKKHKRCCLNSD